MKINIYQVDAFTSAVFGGNPAAVCPLDQWIDASLMLNIAAENNLAETAFFVRIGKGKYEIRWFMPHDEIDLCGHATLATAYVIFEYIEQDITVIEFQSQSGLLKAIKADDGQIVLDFPSRPPKPIHIQDQIYKAFNHTPREAAAARDLVLLFNSEEEIRTLEYDLQFFKDLPYLCIIATARGTHCDFVSRVFDAHASMPEDPVTGSAHSSLVPYWQKKMQKGSFKARQLSERGGDLNCTLVNDRVHIAGTAVLYLEGIIHVPDSD